jgi:hypothetical protein
MNTINDTNIHEPVWRGPAPAWADPEASTPGEWNDLEGYQNVWVTGTVTEAAGYEIAIERIDTEERSYGTPKEVGVLGIAIQSTSTLDVIFVDESDGKTAGDNARALAAALLVAADAADAITE